MNAVFIKLSFYFEVRQTGPVQVSPGGGLVWLITIIESLYPYHLYRFY